MSTRSVKDDRYYVRSLASQAADHRGKEQKKYEIDEEHRMFLQKVLQAAEKLSSTTSEPVITTKHSLCDDVDEKEVRTTPLHRRRERLASKQLNVVCEPVLRDAFQFTILPKVNSSSMMGVASLQANKASEFEPVLSKQGCSTKDNRNPCDEEPVIQVPNVRKLEWSWCQNSADEPMRKQRCCAVGNFPAEVTPRPTLSTTEIQCPASAAAEESSNCTQFNGKKTQVATRMVNQTNFPETISSVSMLAAQAQVQHSPKHRRSVPMQAGGTGGVQASEMKDASTTKPKSRRKRGPKILKCQHCNVRFRQPSAVRSHVRTVHLGERRFACPMQGCSQRFGASGDVTRHIDSVHLEKREYKCDICGALLSRNTVRYRHMRHVHGVEPLRGRVSRTD